MYYIYIEGSENQLKFLYNVGIADKREKIVSNMISKLKKITPNPNRDIIPKESWKILITPIKEEMGLSWRAFSQGINTAYCGTSLFQSGVSRARMLRIYKVLNHPSILDIANSDIFWDEIVSIKPLGVKDVYDATVEGAHNFVSGKR